VSIICPLRSAVDKIPFSPHVLLFVKYTQKESTWNQKEDIAWARADFSLFFLADSDRCGRKIRLFGADPVPRAKNL
jgi:hypothetical protein